MKRPLTVWLTLAACLAVGFGVLAWFSREMLRLDRESREAQRIASEEESIRLALWRMDSALASIHGLEAARPWQEYQPFFRADAAYTEALAPLPERAVMLPSPLLTFTPPFVQLHFQIDAAGDVTSPQAPPPMFRRSALQAGASADRLDAAAARLNSLRANLSYLEWRNLLPPPPSPKVPAPMLAAEAPAPGGSPAQELEDRLNMRRERSQSEAFMAPAAPASAPAAEVYKATEAAPREFQQQQMKSAAESLERSTLLAASNVLSTDAASNRSQSYAPPERSESSGRVAPSAAAPARALAGNGPTSADRETGAAADEATALREARPAARSQSSVAAASATDLGRATVDKDDSVSSPAPANPAVTGALQALWLGNDLVFARRVTRPDGELIQGVWLDWAELQAWLLSRVADLLPEARLTAVAPGSVTSAFDASRRLAFLPVQLVPGQVTYAGGAAPSPLRISLGAAWACAVLGAAALALLLRGTLRLSERRGTFVSAVTHELRTPLTTFRMYTEMLSGGMVTDESKRRDYLTTLRREAERLSHLVENVLSYARLERGRAASRVEDTTAEQLLARCEERLRQRAEQGGLELRVQFTGDAGGRPLRTDVTAVEQILFNLVDNATKYGRPPGGGGGAIGLTVAPRSGGAGVVIRVADHGAGIASAVRKRLFQPFSKSAAEAAQSQPGVGLGLALSRRLARDELHGELALERSGPDGTVFRLELPGN